MRFIKLHPEPLHPVEPTLPDSVHDLHEQLSARIPAQFPTRIAGTILEPPEGESQRDERQGRDYRQLMRWEHEAVIERMQQRLDRMLQVGRLRRQTVEHTFGTLKSWMGATHFLTKRLPRVRTEVNLQVLAYNLKRVMQIMGVQPLIAAMWA